MKKVRKFRKKGLALGGFSLGFDLLLIFFHLEYFSSVQKSLFVRKQAKDCVFFSDDCTFFAADARLRIPTFRLPWKYLATLPMHRQTRPRLKVLAMLLHNKEGNCVHF